MCSLTKNCQNAARDLLTGFLPKLVKDVDFFAVLLNVSGAAVVCAVTLTKSKTQDMSRPNLIFAHFKGDALGKKAWVQQNLIFEKIEQASAIAHQVNEIIRSSSALCIHGTYLWKLHYHFRTQQSWLKTPWASCLSLCYSALAKVADSAGFCGSTSPSLLGNYKSSLHKDLAVLEKTRKLLQLLLSTNSRDVKLTVTLIDHPFLNFPVSVCSLVKPSKPLCLSTYVMESKGLKVCGAHGHDHGIRLHVARSYI